MMAIIEDADGAMLRAAVVADPDDRLARLAYADWCDDSGHSDYADYIRFALGESDRPPRVRWRRWFDPWWAGPATGYRPYGTAQYRVIRGNAPARVPEECVRISGGFVEAVTCPLGTWLAVGKAWLDRHPVRVVEISGKRPSPVSHDWNNVWVRHGAGANFYHPDVLPPAVFDAMPGCAGSAWVAFTDVNDAYDALAVAIKAVTGCRGGWSMATAPF